ncbi:unnamed protein product [Effrenium voratum]|nr:unnamed protein product [Effrenium voratum]
MARARATDGPGTRRRPSSQCPLATAEIAAWGRASRWAEGLNLFWAMPAARISPDTISYNATVSCCERGSWQMAMLALAGADVIGCSIAVSGCEKRGCWLEALALLAGQISLDVVCYNSGISACASAFRWQAAVALLVSATARPDVVSFNSAISAADKERASGKRRWAC